MNDIKLRHILVRIVHHNDERAFSAFFDYYHTRLINLAMIFISQYDLAEEVVSQVFLKLLRKKEDLLKIERLESYMFSMVKNHALNLLKSRSKLKGNILIDDIQDHLTSELINPDEKLINDDLSLALSIAIQKLPPKRRMVFKMIKDEGMSYLEVSNIMEISERTVETHLKLAIQDLRAVLQQHYNEYTQSIPISRQRFLSLFL